MTNAERKVESPEQLEPSADAAKPGGVGSAVRSGLRLYNHLDKLDRVGGGGFGLSTLVKLAGWAGLIAVLAALVVKLRTIEQQLDPVSHGVAQLQQELEVARTQLQERSSASQADLDALDHDARQLHGELQTDAKVRARVTDALSASAAQARQLETNVRDGATQAQALDTSATALAASVADVQKQLDAKHTALETTLASDSEAAAKLAASLGTVDGEAAALDKSLGALDVRATQSALADVDARAKSLSDALAQATARANELDRVLAQRTAEEQAARTSRREPPAAPRSRAAPEPKNANDAKDE